MYHEDSVVMHNRYLKKNPMKNLTKETLQKKKGSQYINDCDLMSSSSDDNQQIVSYTATVNGNTGTKRDSSENAANEEASMVVIV